MLLIFNKFLQKIFKEIHAVEIGKCVCGYLARKGSSQKPSGIGSLKYEL